MKITRIKPPKFRVGRYVLNEYEFAQLRLEIFKGDKPDTKCKCLTSGITFRIKSDGGLTEAPIAGLDILTDIHWKCFRLGRNKK